MVSIIGDGQVDPDVRAGHIEVCARRAGPVAIELIPACAPGHIEARHRNPKPSPFVVDPGVRAGLSLKRVGCRGTGTPRHEALIPAFLRATLKHVVMKIA